MDHHARSRSNTAEPVPVPRWSGRTARWLNSPTGSPAAVSDTAAATISPPTEATSTDAAETSRSKRSQGGSSSTVNDGASTAR